MKAVLALTLSLALALSAAQPAAGTQQEMVSTQIEARGIRDPRVLAALRDVPRREFVPRYLREEAFDDNPLPIGHGQTISQPYIVALMSEMLAIEPGHRVLEIGTGSGYQAAILSKLAAKVYSVEIVEPLGRDARERLERLGHDNVEIRIGDGYQGWPGEAPFDRIILTAAPPAIPQALIDQLAPGGRLIAPEGGFGQMQRLMTIDKDAEGRVTRTPGIPVRFVPMVRAEERN